MFQEVFLPDWMFQEPLPDSFFRKLTKEEEGEFREYARNMSPEEAKKATIFHPIVRDELRNRGLWNRK
ncbi:MAG: hypothetical protein GX491_23160 [Chloroflexi bacterium]|nr:hypothetical protein [Chloroflexota bacterium]